VRGHLGDIGVAVTELGTEDVILPGNMRELINKVSSPSDKSHNRLLRTR
jgi:hypothetical protein